eukprot:GHRQ01029668.1.p2 GENE.GHRQ01029668.1~~GHRQ01029668.1.p2  ORF type:complete len:100 (+),score=3.44 GHRQ01029668.1:405-704(+)
MFWYRNNIYAIEARSPAEGAYSEGFIKAKFTQVRRWPVPTRGKRCLMIHRCVVGMYPHVCFCVGMGRSRLCGRGLWLSSCGTCGVARHTVATLPPRLMA